VSLLHYDDAKLNIPDIENTIKAIAFKIIWVFGARVASLQVHIIRWFDIEG